MESGLGQGDLIPGNKELKFNYSKAERNGPRWKSFAVRKAANNTKTK
jgi:hypothetical protein